MRPGQNKRMRGRPNTNNNSNGGGGNRKGPNPLTRSYESNGPDVKIRGNAHHVAEKYLQLARDAQSSGDPVAAESYLQHAEHYFRLIASAQQAQAGFSRQPDAVDTEGEDEDESGIPDRFASPQAPVPYVPPVQPQPYAAERQPYNGDRQGPSGDRQPYGDRQANTNGERPPYGDRQVNGERPAFGDRTNDYRAQRQDRNGLNRRPYRDNADRSTEPRPDDRGGQERPYQDRGYQNRRNGQDRNFDRQDRGQGDRIYREPQAETPRDHYAGEQPRIDAAERQPEVVVADVQPIIRADPNTRPESSQAFESPPRTDPALRAIPGDPPGLPSFITTPTRVAVDPTPAAETGLATVTSFPGDGVDDAPKFPRRRRRSTRAVATAEPSDAGDLPVSGD